MSAENEALVRRWCEEVWNKKRGRGDHLGIPATHREVSFSAMSFVRFRNGQIIEGWNSVDMHGMLQQIGAVEMKAVTG